MFLVFVDTFNAKETVLVLLVLSLKERSFLLLCLVEEGDVLEGGEQRETPLEVRVGKCGGGVVFLHFAETSRFIIIYYNTLGEFD